MLRAEPGDDEDFLLRLEGGDRISASRLLLAIGLRDVWPDVPGIENVYGANAHVCPDCDGYDCQGKKVVVIGNGRRAVGMALNLTTWTRDIIICTNGRPADLDEQEYCDKLDALNIPVLTDRITQVCDDGANIHCLMLENGMQLDTDKVFFAIGQYPADDLGDAARLRTRRRGPHPRRRDRTHVGQERLCGGRHHAGAAASNRGGRRGGDRRVGDAQVVGAGGAKARPSRARYQLTVIVRGFLSRITWNITDRFSARTDSICTSSSVVTV